MRIKWKKVLKFIGYVFSPIALGGIVTLLVGSKTYKVINKPPLSPPGIVFPIVWSILYLLMGIGHYMVQKDDFNKQTFTIFSLQLLANLIWPFLFFKFKLFTLSAFWIVLIQGLLIGTIIRFLEKKKIAGYLQFPYFVWLIIALYLNIGVAILN